MIIDCLAPSIHLNNLAAGACRWWRLGMRRRTAGKGLGWQGKEAAAGEYKQGPDREVLDEEKICSWVCEALPCW